MRDAAQGNFEAVLERRRPRQPGEPRRDPGAVPFGELTGLAKAAARRHGENGFTRHSDDAKCIAAGLAMTTQANQMDSAVADDLNGLRLGRTTVKQRTQSHGREFRQERTGGIVAYSLGSQGIFFVVDESTLSCDQIAIDRKGW